ncbi:MAG: hypothetical protein LQ347_003892 [Umbilicaria vellea]|nr:MAG: hypothetical protein LQ347_003892 [Umbilicaria vellea]
MAITAADPLVSWVILILSSIVAAVYAPFLLWSFVAVICYFLIYRETTSQEIRLEIKVICLEHQEPFELQEISLEHKEPSIEHQEPSLEHQDTLEHQEISLEHKEPSIEHQEPSLEHQDTLEHQEISLEHKEPSIEHQEISLEHEVPSLEYDGDELKMDQQAEALLTIIKDNNVPLELKLTNIGELKANIKHRHVPDAAISPSFEIIRIGLMSLALQDAAFSTLSHLTKRLVLQEQQHIVAAQGANTYPLLVERLGDQKDRVRIRASQAFTDFWLAASADVEGVIRDVVLPGKHPRAKEAGLQWISKMNQEQGLQFRSFVPKLVDCLEDADGTVREAAKVTTVELFRNAPDHAKYDLKKQLHQCNVRKTIATHVLSQLGLVSIQEVDLKASTQSHVGELPKKDETLAASVNGEHPAAPSPSSTAEDAEQLEPIYVNTNREIEDIFREASPYFEGKESEQNWTHREKTVVKLRKITKGNAPSDFTATYLLSVKGLLDGILKTVNSLRTTVSTNGCLLVQDIAKAAGPGLDPMVEILMQSLIKLCGGTKKISAQNGNATVNAILAHVSYNVRLVQHIWTACQDKNVQPRSFATEWLKTIITIHGHHKHTLEHAGGLELIEKCIKKGLKDANPGVRTSMRPTYWAFFLLWPDRSDSITSALEPKQQELLLKDSANPNPSKAAASITATTSKAASLPRSTTSRPSLKETIAAQKRAKLAGKDLSEHPGSSQASLLPTGSLSSAPVRPIKSRRTELPRPATADPFATRRFQKPWVSPGVAPIREKPRIPAPAAGTSRSKVAARKMDGAGKAKKFVVNRASSSDDHLVLHPQSPTKAAEDFTMVMPNMNLLKQGRITSHNGETKPATAKTIPEVSAATDSILTKSTEDMPNPMSPTAILGVNGHMSLSRLEDMPNPMSPTAILGVNGHMSSSRLEDIRTSMSPKAILDVNGNISSKRESGIRKSMIPRVPHSRKENMAVSRVQDPGPRFPEPMKVYEDPSAETEIQITSCPVVKVTALEELPVNEPTNSQFTTSASPDHVFADETNRQNAKGARVLNGSRQESIYQPTVARRMVESGIDRMRAGFLDTRGLRKVQAMIQTTPDIWDDATTFDETLMALLELLEPSNTESGTGVFSKAIASWKLRVLIGIRLMLKHYQDSFSIYYSVALPRMVSARKHYMGGAHIAILLEETVKYIVRHCDPHLCIDGMLDLMENEKKDEEGKGTRILGMFVLAGLLKRNTAREENIDDLPPSDMDRLCQVSVMGMKDPDSDIRRAAVEYTCALHDFIEQEKFWEMAVSPEPAKQSLVTYYLAKSQSLVNYYLAKSET